MKKYFLVVILSVFLSTLLANTLKCDLNKEDCTLDVNGTKISFSIYPKPIMPMVPTSIKISGLEVKNLKAKIYSLDMNMGIFNVEFKKMGSFYVGNFTLNACSMGVMRYRLELFDDEKDLNIFIDFDLRG